MKKRNIQCSCGLNIAPERNCTYVPKKVAVVHEHVWDTVCSVCATGARVAQPFVVS